jgi:U3 small nucleolar RNA-associated protein 13
LQEEEVLRGQELENAVSDSDYAKAIQLAFELRRPHRLLDLFSKLARYYFLIRMKLAALNY